MPDDEKPDPIEDVRKGLGLLFRAARAAIDKLPRKDLEDVVVTGAREVGRAIENVGKVIERDVFGKAAPPPPPEPPAKPDDTEPPKPSP
jgi:hypothetical protein